MELKICTACFIAKPTSEFHRMKSSKDGFVYRCKTCTKIYTKSHYTKNSDRIKSRVKCYNKERAAWKKDQDRKNFNKRRYIQYGYNATNRALRKQATVKWANKTAIKQYHLIAVFPSAELGSPFHVDHIVPIRSEVVCGLHWELNLSIMLGAWNIAKGNRFWPDMPD